MVKYGKDISIDSQERQPIYRQKWRFLSWNIDAIAEDFNMSKDQALLEIWLALSDSEIKARGWVAKVNYEGEIEKVYGVKPLSVDWFFWSPPDKGEEFELLKKDVLLLQSRSLRADGVEVDLLDINNVFY